MILSGNLKTITSNFALCAITLNETDYDQQILAMADENGDYRTEVSAGTWNVTLTPSGGVPKYIGVLAVTETTKSGALDAFLTHISEGKLDITVLAYMNTLLSQARQAAESASQVINFKTESVSNAVKSELISAVKKDRQAAKKAADDAGQIAENLKQVNTSISEKVTLLESASSEAQKFIRDAGEKLTEMSSSSASLQNNITDLEERLGQLQSAQNTIETLKDEASQSNQAVQTAKTEIDKKIEKFNSASDGLTTPKTFTDSFDNAVLSNHYFFNVSSAGTDKNHPIPNSGGNTSWGLMWVIPRSSYPMQMFLNYENQLFCRVRSNGGWQPWWQLGGIPVSQGVGTLCLGTCTRSLRLYQRVSGYDFNIDGGRAVGSWMSLGCVKFALNGYAGLFVRIR